MSMRSSGTEDHWVLEEDPLDQEVKGAVLAHGEVPLQEWLQVAPLSEADSAGASRLIFLRAGNTGDPYLVTVPVPPQDGFLSLEIDLKDGSETLSRTHVFETHWRNMPLSLFNVETAIRNLTFIQDRERIRAMLRGSREDRREAFESFWAERDPTPATPENELMEEYYRRIDYAAIEFRTGKRPGPDGLGTDQARIYIVHGPPIVVDRSFPDSGGVRETWDYADGRRFVFWAATSLDPLALTEQ